MDEFISTDESLITEIISGSFGFSSLITELLLSLLFTSAGGAARIGATIGGAARMGATIGGSRIGSRGGRIDSINGISSPSPVVTDSCWTFKVIQLILVTSYDGIVSLK